MLTMAAYRIGGTSTITPLHRHRPTGICGRRGLGVDHRRVVGVRDSRQPRSSPRVAAGRCRGPSPGSAARCPDTAITIVSPSWIDPGSCHSCTRSCLPSYLAASRKVDAAGDRRHHDVGCGVVCCPVVVGHGESHGVAATGREHVVRLGTGLGRRPVAEVPGVGGNVPVAVCGSVASNEQESPTQVCVKAAVGAVFGAWIDGCVDRKSPSLPS